LRTILLDADMLAYRYAFACETEIQWDDDTWTYHGDMSRARDGIQMFLRDIKDVAETNDVVFYLSDTKANWRREVMPTYKGERAGWRVEMPSILPPKPGPRRPMLWKPIREWLAAEFQARMLPGLEGDDMVGIAATTPSTEPVERIIVSEDKDLRTIPGLHLSPRRLNEGIVEVTPRQAARFHLMQTLAGDRTDGYTGVPMIGEKRADKILGDVDPESPEAWIRVVQTYRSKRLNEDTALMNARVARVLRYGEYNPETEEVTLWEPNRA
jgi:DNA polymerase-1